LAFANCFQWNFWAELEEEECGASKSELKKSDSNSKEKTLIFLAKRKPH